jgi:hypothetical protein
MKLSDGTQGELMVALPLSNLPRNYNVDPNAPHQSVSDDSSVNWLRVTSAATLVTGGALLLAGKNRLGLVAAAAGTSLAMLDQQDTLKKWWTHLPRYIADVQEVLAHVEGAVEEFAHQRERLSKAIGR